MAGDDAVAVHDDAHGDGAGLVDAAVCGVGIHEGHQIAESQIIQTIFRHRLLIKHLDVVVPPIRLLAPEPGAHDGGWNQVRDGDRQFALVIRLRVHAFQQ